MSPFDTVTVPDLLERNAHTNPEKTFVAFDDTAWTCEETLVRSRRIANALIELGVQPGDCVGTWLPNGPEALLTWFGVNTAGATAVPLNIAYTGSFAAAALDRSRVRVLVAHAELLPRLLEVELPHLELVIVVGDGAATASSRQHAIGFDTLLGSDEHPVPADRRPQPWDDMLVIATSGTTGASKGVRCSYRHHAAFADWRRVGDLGPADRSIVTTPMFHLSGAGLTYSMLHWNASLAIVPRFRTETFWDDVRRLEATSGTLLGAMVTFLLDVPERDDDRDNPLRIALLTPYHPRNAAFAERFDVDLWAGFGMSEVPGPLRTGLFRGDRRSVGTVTSPQWQVRLVDEHDIEVPVGTPGELVVRHDEPWVITSGYVGMPEATAAAWRNGWFHTGDLMRRDAAGDYQVVDRIKDSLRRRGENISSTELEREIAGHPAIAEVAVIGVPAGEGDDDVAAFVRLRAGEPFDCESLIRFLVDRVPHYMVPRYVEVVDDFPRTQTEKVQKAGLRERGLGPGAWDRVAAGIVVKATRLSPG